MLALWASTGKETPTLPLFSVTAMHGRSDWSCSNEGSNEGSRGRGEPLSLQETLRLTRVAATMIRSLSETPLVKHFHYHPPYRHCHPHPEPGAETAAAGKERQTGCVERWPFEAPSSQYVSGGSPTHTLCTCLSRGAGSTTVNTNRIRAYRPHGMNASAMSHCVPFRVPCPALLVTTTPRQQQGEQRGVG